MSARRAPTALWRPILGAVCLLGCLAAIPGAARAWSASFLATTQPRSEERARGAALRALIEANQVIPEAPSPEPWQEAMARASERAAASWEGAIAALETELPRCASAREPAACRRAIRGQLGDLYQHGPESAGEGRRWLETAAALYRSQVEEAPNDAEFVEALAGLELDLGNDGATAALLERLVELAPDRRYVALVALGDLDARGGELDEALARYRAAAAIDPNGEAAWDGVLAVYRQLPERQAELFAEARALLARGQHDLAREAMLQLVASCQRACPELVEEALVEWVDQEANADLLSPARLEVLPEPWPGPALEQLRRLLGVEVHDVAAAAWWAAAPLRRIAAADVLRAAAHRLERRGHIEEATSASKLALAFAPRAGDSTPAEIAARAAAARVAAIVELTALTDRATPLADPSEVDELADRALAELRSDAALPADVRRKANVDLALVLARRERWSDVVWTLEQALASDAATEIGAAAGALRPSLQERLAAAYAANRAVDRAADASLRAAAGYLDLDDLGGAQRALAAAAAGLANGAARRWELDLLGDVLKARLESASPSAASVSTTAPASGEAAAVAAYPWLAATEHGLPGVDRGFLARQRFKVWSDLGSRAERAGDPDAGRRLHALALRSIRAETTVASTGDLLRLETIEATLRREGWFTAPTAITTTYAATGGEPGAGKALAVFETAAGGAPLLAWASDDLFAAADVVAALPIGAGGPGTIPIRVADGRAYAIEGSLPDIVPDQVEEALTVTADSPLLDPRRIETVAQADLERMPVGRDPWVLLQSAAPGPLADSVNVAGSSAAENNYVVDGVAITGMGELATPSNVFDLGVAELVVTTAGADATVAEGGVVVTTRSAVNRWQGSARYLLSRDGWQSHLALRRDELGPDQETFRRGDRIVATDAWSAEGGGPIVEDRAWIWGSYGDDDDDRRTIGDVRERTEVRSLSLKLNAQVTPSNGATLFLFDRDTAVHGRAAGPDRPQPTTWDQRDLGGWPTAWKIEDAHVFRPDLVVTGLYARVRRGYELVPEGGLDSTAMLDADDRWQSSFAFYRTERPQDQARITGEYLFSTARTQHVLKLGASRRAADESTATHWGGEGYQLDGSTNFNSFFGDVLAASRDGRVRTRQRYDGIYLQDEVTLAHLTLSAGLRYDRQSGTNLATSVPASSGSPGLLPGASEAADDPGVDWRTVAPRLGLVYAFGPERKTLVRASFGRFADQLGSSALAWGRALASPAFAYSFSYGDCPECHAVLFHSSNVDPTTGAPLRSSAVDPDLHAAYADQLQLGLERELPARVVLGLNLAYHRIHDLLESELLVFDGDTATCDAAGDPLLCPAFAPSNLAGLGRRHRRSDYESFSTIVMLPDGTTRPLTYFQLRSGVSTRGGTWLENGDREQEYRAATLTFDRRLEDHWMLSGNLTWSDWRWSSVPEHEIENPTPRLGGGDREGDPVLEPAEISPVPIGRGFVNRRWSYNVYGMVEVAPQRAWGFNAALSLSGRQGDPVAYFQRRGGDLARENFARVDVPATSSPDGVRLEDRHTVDARLEKEVTFGGLRVMLGLDCFNVFNRAFVLRRENRLGVTTAGDVQAVEPPRLFRLGARLQFR